MKTTAIIKTPENIVSCNYYENLKAESDICEVVEDLIPDRITTTTPNKLLCDCPNHASQSKESLYIDREKQLWYCFGCSKGGDVIHLVEFLETGDISTGKTGAKSPGHRNAVDYLAERASLPLLEYSELTPEQIEELEKERQENSKTYQCLTGITEFYNKKLEQNQDVLNWFLDHYAISTDTIRDLKIGYSDNEGILESLQFPPDEILSTGSFIRSSSDIIPLFNNRITFPYWSKGKGVVYMIGRKTPWTPENEYENGKYKKLLVHGKKYPYVNKSINNSTLYNEDCLTKNPPFIVITEGVSDVIACIEKGFDAISPVTARINGGDLDRLCKKLAGYAGKIIIVQDNEVSKVGFNGALDNARALRNSGLDARVAELPLEERHTNARHVLHSKYGLDLGKSASDINKQIENIDDSAVKEELENLKKESKIDVNEYFKEGHTSQEFQKILDGALAPLELLICMLDPKGDFLENHKILNQLIGDIALLDAIEQNHYFKEITKKLPEITLGALKKKAAEAKKSNKEDSKKEESSLNKLLNLFNQSGSSFFIDQLGAGWITFKVNNHFENIKIQSPQFEGLMLKNYYSAYRAAVESETIKRMGILLTEWATERRYLFNRYAWLGDRLLIDIGDKDWHAIEVSAKLWRIIQPEQPVFRRFSHQIPIPFPEKGGDIRKILGYLSIKDEGNIALLLVWLCTCMFEHVSRPGIIFHGTHGSCKTSAADFLRLIVDPSSVLHSSLSKDHTEFVQFIDHHAVVSLDNLSGLPRWACDDLCIAVTGGGLSKRSLYTNDDDFTYCFRRAFILNGISVPTAAPDLLDRSILIELNRLDKKDRKRETKLKKAFEADLPYILGSILDVMVSVISRREEELDEYTRLADWFGLARIAADTLDVLDDFLNAFNRNEKEQHREVVESHIESQILLQFMQDRDSWTGSSAELYKQLSEIAEEARLKRSWPKNASSFVKKLKKLLHNFREMGIYIENDTTGKIRTISITRAETKADEVSHLVPNPTKDCGFPVSPVSAVKSSDINMMELTRDECASVSAPVNAVSHNEITRGRAPYA